MVRNGNGEGAGAPLAHPFSTALHKLQNMF